jgi:hypothetical protein
MGDSLSTIFTSSISVCLLGAQYSRGVISLGPDAMEWVRPKTNGTPPVPRHSHTGTLVGNRIVFFGGWGGNWRLNDLWVLDTGESPVVYFLFFRSISPALAIAETLTWSRQSPTGGAPGGRFGHTANAVGSKIVVLKGDSGKKAAHDLFLLDTGVAPGRARPLPALFVYAVLAYADTISWTAPVMAGSPPPPREGHSSVVLGARLLLLGGSDGVRRYNDVFLLDARTTPLCGSVRGVTPGAAQCRWCRRRTCSMRRRWRWPRADAN